jgi:uncharacterized protein YndB with AHSA1/START domain
MSMETQDLSPVVTTVEVNRSIEVAFKTFTEGLESWWPRGTHSIGEGKIERIVFDDRAGGRIYERWEGGHEEPWADILAWDPPRRIVLAWHPNPEATVSTEVEITFTDADGNTTVRLEHRDWHLLGDGAAQAREDYATGWPRVLDLFVGATG